MGDIFEEKSTHIKPSEVVYGPELSNKNMYGEFLPWAIKLQKTYFPKSYMKGPVQYEKDW